MKTKMKLKSVAALLFVSFALCLSACKNQPTDFDDYGTTAVYFPYQTPIRTIILGNYDAGINDNDNNHCFEIGASMSGVYTNETDRLVYFSVDETLLDNVANVEAMPADYYTIETSSPAVISVGDTKGRILVQLTDKFFEDLKSVDNIVYSVNYVIPIRMTGCEGFDYIISGEAAVEDPCITVADHWDVLPKNYTLFGVKYINKYSGYYLRRGSDERTAADGTTSEVVYQEEYVEYDELTLLTTYDFTTVDYTNRIRRDGDTDEGTLALKLQFDDEDKCEVTMGGVVIGSGSFVEDGDEWGGNDMDVIYLDYSYTSDSGDLHHVQDTLVVRDRNVVFETFEIENY